MSKLGYQQEQNRFLEKITDPALLDHLYLLEQYRDIVDESNIVSKTNPKGIITFTNKKFEEISGFSSEELIGKPHNIIRHPDMPSSTFKSMWDSIREKKTWHGVIKNRKKNGGYYIVDATIIPIIDSQGEITEYIAIRKDITSLIEQARKIKRQATDALTELPSYNQLVEDIEKAEENGKHKTLFLFNLDFFREIVDFYGEDVSNRLLVEVSHLLSNLLEQVPGFNVYKLYGDEFAFFKPEEMEKTELGLLLLKLHECLSEMSVITVENIDIHFSISSGAYTGGEPRPLNKAKIALKHARENKRIFFIYDDDLRRKHRDNLNSVRMIKHAIATNRIVPFYQPILNNETGVIEKYESLARILGPGKRIYDPETFLKVAKKSKLYPYITSSIVKNVLELAVRHQSEKQQYEYSINLSVEDIMNKKVQEMILNEVSASSVDGKNIIFELTESENIDDFLEVKAFIEKAKSLGCKIAIDDFGTGYSNFEYLVELNIDYLKIDGSLIRNLNLVPNLQIIVRTIINFAKEMHIKTVAEYIHSREVFDIVKDLGIEFSQGYYIGRPERIS